MANEEINYTNKDKLYSLQILRGLAALMVFFHHIKGYTNIVGNKPQNFYNYIPEIFGYGAPLFFCLSGFIMAYLIESNYEHFLFKRFLRIYPPYLITVIITIMFKLIVLGNVSIYNLPKVITLLPFGSDIIYPLGIEWTLIYEIFFYIICSIFTLKGTKKFFKPFLILWTIIISIGFYFFKIPTEIAPNIKQIPFSTLNYIFIMGALIFYISKSNFKISNHLKYFICCVDVILMCIVYYNMAKYPNIYNSRFLIFSLLFGILIIIFKDFNFKPNNYLITLGDYSYGIYLIHAQVIYLVLTIWKDIFYLPITWFATTSALLISILISWYYGKLEFKFHQKIKNFKLPTIHIYKKHIIAFLIVILSLAIFFTQYINRQLNLNKTLETFDTNKIIHENYESGWVDEITTNKDTSNQNVSLVGWAIDPINKKPATEVILVSNNKIIPSKIIWYERKGLSKILKINNVEMAGFTLSVNTNILDSGKYKLYLYSLTYNGKYIPLKTNQQLYINVNK